MKQQQRRAGVPTPPAFTRQREAPARSRQDSAPTPLLPPFVRRPTAQQASTARSGRPTTAAPPTWEPTAEPAAWEPADEPTTPVAALVVNDEAPPRAELPAEELAGFGGLDVEAEPSEHVARRLEEIAREIRERGMAALDEVAQPDELSRLIARAVNTFRQR